MNTEKIALVAIAKNEDNYLKEWVDYHLKIGFDNITIYQNNWRYSNNDISDCRVNFINADGQKMQSFVYSHFIDNNYQKYKFGCFWDIDEFIKINENDIHDTLKCFDSVQIIGVPRVQFGSSGLKSVKDGNFSVLKRFTKKQIGYETLIKPIVNFNILKNNVIIPNPHIVTNRYIQPLDAIDPSKSLTTTNGNYYEINKMKILEPFHLNHYVLKSLEERIERRKCGDAYFGDQWRLKENFENDFFEKDKYLNEIEDRSLCEFL